MTVQIPLHFEFRGDKVFENFYAGANPEIVEHLKKTAEGSGEQQIFLWGDNGMGKSHLLQACCQAAHVQKRSAFYFDIAAGLAAGPSVLEGIDEFALVCLDNIEAVSGDPAWEQALFHFYNRHRELGNSLVTAAAMTPQALDVKLPDLKTRLAWGLTLHLQAGGEAEKIALLAFRAKRLGFDVTPQVGRFLLQHYARDLPSLWALLDQLDHETLAAKRKLTLPFLKHLLEVKA